MLNIKSDREFLWEIFKKITNREYAIPVFQRDFVWTQQQIIDLFDSIWNGYPIGSIILWAPDSMIPAKHILTDEIDKDDNTPMYFVLDGRQRLTAFYGCVQSRVKNSKFNLYFNLNTEKFTYRNEGTHTCVKVSDIYDTFTLLDKLQEISMSVEENKAKILIERAKQLNTVLQGYTATLIVINDCPLKQAEIVFSRINSKGTDIDKTFMLQATTYSKDGVLLTDVIKDIQTSLQKYGFASLPQDIILMCFYKFANKNFYDAKMSDLENMNISEHLKEIKECIINSVRFLYEHCCVWNYKLLPYSKQLIALTWFFKEHPSTTENQIRELKRWFFYTTAAQSFMNGSLNSVRKLFNRFDEFVKGTKDSAIDYQSIENVDFLNFNYNLKTAKTDLLLISLIGQAKRNIKDCSLKYYGVYNILKGKDPGYYFLYLRRDDEFRLQKALTQGGIENDDKWALCIDEEVAGCFKRNDIKSFLFKRKDLMIKAVNEMLKEVGLKGIVNFSIPNGQDNKLS